ncbi:MAG TPA: ABC transporter permease [Candidatus Nitrosopolaris sp.]|nr:ABC transporter permease [Candidatus Nitrosopolaris sp.]
MIINRSSLIPVLAIVRKDIGVWLRQPTSIAATVLPAIAFMIILYFGAQAVGRNPVALVVQDNGPLAQKLVNILTHSDAFRIAMISATPEKAEEALKQLKVAAVISIPNTFDAAYNAQKSDPVTIHINNLNLDFTNDLRRSLPAAITEFYADKADSNGNTSPIQILVKETDLRKQDIDLLRFELVPILVLLLTTAGIVNAGLATAREWEDSTIKELLLAPISKTSLIVGKLLSGWFTTLLIAAVVLVVGAASGYLRPEDPIYWISTLVIVLLIALASAGLGVAIGASARRFQRVTAIGIPLSIDLFFLSGGITVAAFLPTWLQTIAHFVPTFYGTQALQTAIFYHSTQDLALDLSVLAGTSLVSGTLGVLSLRRSMLA